MVSPGRDFGRKTSGEALGFGQGKQVLVKTDPEMIDHMAQGPYLGVESGSEKRVVECPDTSGVS